MTVVYALSNAVFAHAAESNLWAERRRSAAQARRPQGLLAAASPSPDRVLNRLPPLERASSLPSPSVRAPRDFLESHAALLGALPPETGSVRKVSLPSSGRASRVVLHIQDVHLNPDAQRNISRAVASLSEKNAVSFIALEGAFGPIDLSRYQSFPDRGAVRKAADFLLKDDGISGPVHAALSGPFLPLFGVDDARAHGANVAAYAASAPLAAGVKPALSARKAALEARKDAVFNPALRALDRIVQGRHDGAVPLGEAAEALAAAVPAESVPSAVRAFSRARARERSLDFERVEKDRAVLISRLAAALSKDRVSALVDRAAAYRLGRIRYAEFYRFLETLCREAGEPLARYPAMDAYVRYVLDADRIDAEELFDQLAGLERSACDRLARLPEEASLLREARFLRLQEKLSGFTLTPAEWAEYADFPAAWRRALPPAFESFYREARARDAAMAENLLARMAGSKASAAALVAGGYHGPGLTRALLDAGVAVVSFTPRIDRLDDSKGSAYLSVFMREKTPLEKMFRGPKLFLAQPPEKDVSSGRAALAAAGVSLLAKPGEGDLSDRGKRLLLSLEPALFSEVDLRLTRLSLGTLLVTLASRAKGAALRRLSVSLSLDAEGDVASFDQSEEKSWGSVSAPFADAWSSLVSRASGERLGGLPSFLKRLAGVFLVPFWERMEIKRIAANMAWAEMLKESTGDSFSRRIAAEQAEDDLQRFVDSHDNRSPAEARLRRLALRRIAKAAGRILRRRAAAATSPGGAALRTPLLGLWADVVNVVLHARHNLRSRRVPLTVLPGKKLKLREERRFETSILKRAGRFPWRVLLQDQPQVVREGVVLRREKAESTEAVQALAASLSASPHRLDAKAFQVSLDPRFAALGWDFDSLESSLIEAWSLLPAVMEDSSFREMQERMRRAAEAAPRAPVVSVAALDQGVYMFETLGRGSVSVFGGVHPRLALAPGARFAKELFSLGIVHQLLLSHSSLGDYERAELEARLLLALLGPQPEEQAFQDVLSIAGGFGAESSGGFPALFMALARGEDLKRKTFVEQVVVRKERRPAPPAEEPLPVDPVPEVQRSLLAWTRSSWEERLRLLESAAAALLSQPRAGRQPLEEALAALPSLKYKILSDRDIVKNAVGESLPTADALFKEWGLKGDPLRQILRAAVIDIIELRMLRKGDLGVLFVVESPAPARVAAFYTPSGRLDSAARNRNSMRLSKVVDLLSRNASSWERIESTKTINQARRIASVFRRSSATSGADLERIGGSEWDRPLWLVAEVGSGTLGPAGWTPERLSSLPSDGRTPVQWEEPLQKGQRRWVEAVIEGPVKTMSLGEKTASYVDLLVGSRRQKVYIIAGNPIPFRDPPEPDGLDLYRPRRSSPFSAVVGGTSYSDPLSAAKAPGAPAWEGEFSLGDGVPPLRLSVKGDGAPAWDWPALLRAALSLEGRDASELAPLRGTGLTLVWASGGSSLAGNCLGDGVIVLHEAIAAPAPFRDARLNLSAHHAAAAMALAHEIFAHEIPLQGAEAHTPLRNARDLLNFRWALLRMGLGREDAGKVLRAYDNASLRDEARAAASHRSRRLRSLGRAASASLAAARNEEEARAVLETLLKAWRPSRGRVLLRPAARTPRQEEMLSSWGFVRLSSSEGRGGTLYGLRDRLAVRAFLKRLDVPERKAGRFFSERERNSLQEQRERSLLESFLRNMERLEASGVAMALRAHAAESRADAGQGEGESPVSSAMNRALLESSERGAVFAMDYEEVLDAVSRLKEDAGDLIEAYDAHRLPDVAWERRALLSSFISLRRSAGAYARQLQKLSPAPLSAEGLREDVDSWRRGVISHKNQIEFAIRRIDPLWKRVLAEEAPRISQSGAKELSAVFSHLEEFIFDRLIRLKNDPMENKASRAYEVLWSQVRSLSPLDFSMEGASEFLAFLLNASLVLQTDWESRPRGEEARHVEDSSLRTMSGLVDDLFMMAGVRIRAEELGLPSGRGFFSAVRSRTPAYLNGMAMPALSLLSLLPAPEGSAGILSSDLLRGLLPLLSLFSLGAFAVSIAAASRGETWGEHLSDRSFLVSLHARARFRHSLREADALDAVQETVADLLSRKSRRRFSRPEAEEHAFKRLDAVVLRAEAASKRRLAAEKAFVSPPPSQRPRMRPFPEPDQKALVLTDHLIDFLPWRLRFAASWLLRQSGGWVNLLLLVASAGALLSSGFDPAGAALAASVAGVFLFPLRDSPKDLLSRWGIGRWSRVISVGKEPAAAARRIADAWALERFSVDDVAGAAARAGEDAGPALKREWSRRGLARPSPADSLRRFVGARPASIDERPLAALAALTAGDDPSTLLEDHRRLRSLSDEGRWGLVLAGDSPSVVAGLKARARGLPGVVVIDRPVAAAGLIDPIALEEGFLRALPRLSLRSSDVELRLCLSRSLSLPGDVPGGSIVARALRAWMETPLSTVDLGNAFRLALLIQSYA